MKTKKGLPFICTFIVHGQALQQAVWYIDLDLHSSARMSGPTVAPPASLVITISQIVRYVQI